MSSVGPNPAAEGESALQRATRARREATLDRARTALTAMSRAGEPITFAAVARRARVSTDFLYRHPELRERIVGLRRPGAAGPIGISSAVAVSDSTAAVRALSAQVKLMRRDHAIEVDKLRRALELAHGENLALRRRLRLDPSNLPAAGGP